VAYHLDEYRNFLDMFALWEGGATLYGGLILTVLVSYAFAAKNRLPFLRLADIISPSIALGIMFTRIGCFMSGCCYGKPTSLPWGVQFPDTCAAGYYSRQMAEALSLPVVHLHPAQLYASLYGLVIFLLLLLFERRLKKLGGTFGAFLLLYGISRFVLDFFRFYEENMRIFIDLTLNQLLSVGLVALGLVLLLRRDERDGAEGAKQGGKGS
jgi:phosphatidylglycerol:prolipoprotein diacylglycerol transferase